MTEDAVKITNWKRCEKCKNPIPWNAQICWKCGFSMVTEKKKWDLLRIREELMPWFTFALSASAVFALVWPVFYEKMGWENSDVHYRLISENEAKYLFWNTKTKPAFIYEAFLCEKKGNKKCTYDRKKDYEQLITGIANYPLILTSKKPWRVKFKLEGRTARDIMEQSENECEIVVAKQDYLDEREQLMSLDTFPCNSFSEKGL